MDDTAILQRIAQRIKDLGTSEAKVSRAVASQDLIRNWRRLHDAGKPVGLKLPTLKALADELGVSFEWIVGGTDQNRESLPQGFAEEAEPFVGVPNAQAIEAIKAIYPDAKNPQIAFKANALLHDMLICPGDRLVCDMSRNAVPGDIAIVAIADPQTGETTCHLVRRYLPPWLISGGSLSSGALRQDDPNVFVRHPVIGIIRG